MKKYTLKLIEDEKGIHIKRLNDGFNAFEVLGCLEIAIEEIKDMIRGDFKGKVKTIERVSVNNEKKYPLALNVCEPRLLNAIGCNNYFNYDLDTLTIDQLFKDKRYLNRIRGIGTKTLINLNELFKEHGLIK